MNEDIHTFRMVDSACIALSVVILQAFIGTGISDAFVLASVLSFAVAIPLLALFMYITATAKELINVQAQWILFLVQIIGLAACAVGILCAFGHLSIFAGLLFSMTVMISIVLSRRIRRLRIQ